jgi:hypothetical protein
MKHLITILFLLWPFAAVADFAITQVTVIPMDEDRVLPAQVVIVRDGRIVTVGPANRTPIPADIAVIDGRGRYLVPGLAEMHAHVPPQATQRQWTEDILFLYVANGITFARSMLGAPHHLELRARAAEGDLVSPRLYLSGPSLNGNSVATPLAGREMVAEQQRAGYDFLKIHPGLDPERFAAIADEARARGITFGGHVSDQVGVWRALDAGQATIDHLDSYMSALLDPDSDEVGRPSMFFGWNLAAGVDESRIPQLVERTRDAGVWNVPTESLIQHVLAAEPDTTELAARAEMRYVPAAMVAQWSATRRNMMANAAYDADLVRRFIAIRGRLIKALHDGGAGLLLGSDAPQIFNVPGFSIHHELRMLVEAGLTPYEALVTGTRNVATFLDEDASFGVIAEGMRADLVLVERNPLVDIGHMREIAGVAVNGRWLSRAEIDAGLEAIAARHAR